jgi:hypothetical protein
MQIFAVAQFDALICERAALPKLYEAVCTENPIRIDWRRESPNVGAQ